MFGIGSTELLVILLVALVVLGPKNLAGISRTVGRIMGEFRRVSTDFQRTLNAEAAADDLREKEEQRKKEVAANQVPQPTAVPEASVSAGASTNNGQAATQNSQTDPGIVQESQTGNKPAQTANGSDTLVSQAENSDQAKISSQEENDGIELAPPPDSPLARALAQTSAEAARAETVIAETASQPNGIKPESCEASANGQVTFSADAKVAKSDTDGKTDATTGSKTGVSA